jgi:hypothetical protein
MGNNGVVEQRPGDEQQRNTDDRANDRGSEQAADERYRDADGKEEPPDFPSAVLCCWTSRTSSCVAVYQAQPIRRHQPQRIVA